MSQRKSILFVSNVNASFVENDITILKSKFDLIVFYYDGSSVITNLKSVLKLFKIFVLNIFKINATYSWFVDYHSFVTVILSKIFFKKSYLVVGGYDVVYMPEYNYGALVNPFRRKCVKIALEKSTLNLCVSEFIIKKLVENLKIKINAKYKLVFNCVETDFWEIKSTQLRKNQVVCVSLVDSYKKYKIKGIDFYIELAKTSPLVTFVWIGDVWGIKNQDFELPSNLIVYGKMSKEEIRTIMYESKIIAQFSLSESFCVSIIEGIMCGLIPITFNDLGSAELFESGHGLKIERLIELAHNAILQTLDTYGSNIETINFVKNNFNFQQRKEKILDLILF